MWLNICTLNEDLPEMDLPDADGEGGPGRPTLEVHLNSPI
jgi:hypothetical protein